MAKSIFNCTYLILLVILGSCNQISATSDTQHTWGETSRSINGFKFEACKQEQNPEFPASVKYLSDVAHHIMKSNPSVFKAGSNLDPIHFCFKVEKSSVINALADSSTREILFFTPIIKELESTGQFAAVVAHELSHITMSHADTQEHPQYVPSSKYLALKQKIEQLGTQDDLTHLSSLSIPFEKYLSQDPDLKARTTLLVSNIVSNIIDYYNPTDGKTSSKDSNSIYYGGFGTPDEKEFVSTFPANMQEGAIRYLKELAKAFVAINAASGELDPLLLKLKQEVANNIGSVSYNWREQEADEVGFELYLRAGFKPEEAENFLVSLAFLDVASIDETKSLSKCLKTGLLSSQQERVKTLNNDSERGDSSHPSGCWRFTNILFEREAHQEDYNNTRVAGSQDFSALRSKALQEVEQSNLPSGSQQYSTPFQEQPTSSPQESDDDFLDSF